MNNFAKAALERVAAMKHKRGSAVPKFGLAIDWETSGYSLPDYAKNHQGISFGALIFEVATLDIVDSMYREILFCDPDGPTYQWSDEAEKVHGISIEYLAQHGVPQTEAACDLCNMIVKYIGNEKVPLLGHRVYFDEAFTNQLTASIGIQLEYDPIRIDSAAIGLMFLGTGSSDQLFEACGLLPRKAHNSLEDITYTLASLKAIKQAFLE